MNRLAESILSDLQQATEWGIARRRIPATPASGELQCNGDSFIDKLAQASRMTAEQVSTNYRSSVSSSQPMRPARSQCDCIEVGSVASRGLRPLVGSPRDAS